jgi:hypothetical protein
MPLKKQKPFLTLALFAAFLVSCGGIPFAQADGPAPASDDASQCQFCHDVYKADTSTMPSKSPWEQRDFPYLSSASGSAQGQQTAPQGTAGAGVGN